MANRKWQMAELVCCLLVVISSPGCRTAPPLPPADLQQPGWVVREGQAVWRTKREAPEIAGEVLVATHSDGRALVQFTKNPFPLVIAQITTTGWQIELPSQNKRYSGRGKPPTRLIWFYLPRALSGGPLPKEWSWHSAENSGWRLENWRTGEMIEGFFN